MNHVVKASPTLDRLADFTEIWAHVHLGAIHQNVMPVRLRRGPGLVRDRGTRSKHSCQAKHQAENERKQACFHTYLHGRIGIRRPIGTARRQYLLKALSKGTITTV